ncbi:MAG: sulfotransferase, partial [Mesorhizobium sp.]
MTTAELKPPIFLIGNYRSGTTITQKLIGLHPDVVTWYEP